MKAWEASVRTDIAETPEPEIKIKGKAGTCGDDGIERRHQQQDHKAVKHRNDARRQRVDEDAQRQQLSKQSHLWRDCPAPHAQQRPTQVIRNQAVTHHSTRPADEVREVMRRPAPLATGLRVWSWQNAAMIRVGTCH